MESIHRVVEKVLTLLAVEKVLTLLAAGKVLCLLAAVKVSGREVRIRYEELMGLAQGCSIIW